MPKILASLIFSLCAAALIIHAIPPDVVARHAAVQPSFDAAMPVMADLPDGGVITALGGTSTTRTE